MLKAQRTKLESVNIDIVNLRETVSLVTAELQEVYDTLSAKSQASIKGEELQALLVSLEVAQDHLHDAWDSIDEVLT